MSKHDNTPSDTDYNDEDSLWCDPEGVYRERVVSLERDLSAMRERTKGLEHVLDIGNRVNRDSAQRMPPCATSRVPCWVTSR